MKKGFTLVELLGVIVILGIIGMITVPLVQRTIIENNQKLCQDTLGTAQDDVIAASLALERLQVFVRDGCHSCDTVSAALPIELVKIGVHKGAQEIALPILQYFDHTDPPRKRMQFHYSCFLVKKSRKVGGLNEKIPGNIPRDFCCGFAY